MDYYLLTDLAAQVGHGLAISGAETFRVEDTIRRILRAYGIECEVFAIPNCLTISFEAANGKPLTIMKRIGFHGNDLDAVEQFNALSRRICRETPEVEVAMQWLEETQAACRRYSLPVYYLGHYLGAFGYCFVFGGTQRDSLWAGLLALIIGLVASFIVTGSMKGKLKSVRHQTAAGNYVKNDSMKVTQSRDLFLYRQVSRTERPRDEDSGSSDTHTSASGQTHSGGGGKF